MEDRKVIIGGQRGRDNTYPALNAEEINEVPGMTPLRRTPSNIWLTMRAALVTIATDGWYSDDVWPERAMINGRWTHICRP